MNGDATLFRDLGEPEAETEYSLCLYDTSLDEPVFATRLLIPANGLWERTGRNTGYRFSDRDGSFDGVSRVRLKAGLQGRARVTLLARGVNVPMPGPVSPFQYFEFDPALIAQLVNSEGSCWSTTYSVDDVDVNGAERFKAGFR